jgi:hypothetical protein
LVGALPALFAVGMLAALDAEGAAFLAVMGLECR